MKAEAIAENVWWVGVKDKNLKVFDIVMKTRHGTTYNAYLIKGSHRVALIDTVKAQFTEKFFAAIEEVVPVDQISLLVVNHTEPDHSGAMHALVDRLPHLEIVCATAALPFVKNVLNREALLTTVKDNSEIDLGGKKLVFKQTPYMHWPDTMMEYLSEDKILFSCDGFAAHIAFDSLWADEATADFDHEVRYYYDSIMRPFAGYIRKNMAKLEGFDIEMIAPSHGPMIRRDIQKYLDQYRVWSADKTVNKNQVAIVYVSSYGNTARIAETIAAKLTDRGYCPVLINAAECDRDLTRDTLEASRAVLFGTPTFAGDAVKPTWDAVGLLSTIPARDKRAAVFGSYGWGAEGIKLVQQRLEGMKIKTLEEIFKARLVPSSDEMAGIDEWITKLTAFIEGRGEMAQ